MWRDFSICEFGTADRTHLRHKIAVGAFIMLWATTVILGARDGAKDWITLENCRLVPNAANDGDSFHVSVNGKEYMFRLYWVDAPESDAVNPGRLVEQAKHFGITVPQVIELGETAKAFTKQKLSEPFTATTRMANAMGRSSVERFYAFVQTKEGDLGEQLIANGLARIHGTPATPAAGSSSAAERQKLEELEREAKRRQVGGWGMSGQALKAASATPQPSASASHPHAKETPTLGKIDINTATEKELRSVPGIGPVMAARIIAARPFRSADDLKKVNGIGDKNYAKIRPYFQ
jgi:competence ComEA-like helix-hairpin-helix protein